MRGERGRERETDKWMREIQKERGRERQREREKEREKERDQNIQCGRGDQMKVASGEKHVTYIFYETLRAMITSKDVRVRRLFLREGGKKLPASEATVKVLQKQNSQNLKNRDCSRKSRSEERGSKVEIPPLK